MPGSDIRIKASGGGEFDCYVAAPKSGRAPGVILACSVMGVDDDLKGIADRFAEAGFVVAAPDLFWRGDSGPMPRTEEGSRRARARAQPRVECILQGIPDMADTAAMLKARPDCDGKIAAIGFCYGGPYAVIGQARLGFDAGFAYHGTAVHHWMDDFVKVRGPLSLHWGDKDHAAPPEAIEIMQKAAADMPNAELHVYPGVGHGYTSKSGEAWDEEVTRRSIDRTIELLKGLSVAAAAE